MSLEPLEKAFSKESWNRKNQSYFGHMNWITMRDLSHLYEKKIVNFTEQPVQTFLKAWLTWLTIERTFGIHVQCSHWKADASDACRCLRMVN